MHLLPYLLAFSTTCLIHFGSAYPGPPTQDGHGVYVRFAGNDELHRPVFRRAILDDQSTHMTKRKAAFFTRSFSRRMDEDDDEDKDSGEGATLLRRDSVLCGSALCQHKRSEGQPPGVHSKLEDKKLAACPVCECTGECQTKASDRRLYAPWDGPRYGPWDGSKGNNGGPDVPSNDGSAAASAHGSAGKSRPPSHQPQTCEICSVVLSRPDYLKSHMKIFHTDTKKCPSCVEMVTRYELNAHRIKNHQMPVPEGANPVTGRFDCDCCNAVFVEPQLLTRHQKAVHDIKGKFLCNACGFSTETEGQFHNHRRDKHDEKLDFACPKDGCLFTAAKQDGVNTHIGRVHKEMRQGN